MASGERFGFKVLVAIITGGLMLVLWFSTEMPLGATVAMAAALIAAIVLLSVYEERHPEAGRVRLFSAINVALLGLALLTITAAFFLPLSTWVHLASELHRLHLIPDP